MTVIRVRGGGTVRGTATVPGDKSISHRALLLSAVADGTSELSGVSSCRDVRRTADALVALGASVVDVSTSRTRVEGRGPAALRGEAVRIDCGDSGTTLRLMAGLLAGLGRAFTLDGSSGLRRRPMRRVIEPLRRMGARIEATPEGTAPLIGRAGAAGSHAPLTGASVSLQRASAQVGSALLLAGLGAVGVTTVRYPAPVRDHTERMLSDMGAPVRWTDRATTLRGPVARLSPAVGGHAAIPGDMSAAAYLLTAAALAPDGAVRVASTGVNPGRTGLLDVMEAMGVYVERTPLPPSGSEPRASLHVSGRPRRGVTVAGSLVPRAIDELPLLAVLGSQAKGRTVLRDAAELRVKESDRIEAMVDGLARMGARIEARPDGFVVDGPTRLSGARVEGRGDHRIVMALAVAGVCATDETVITDAEVVRDSFPGFVETLRALGVRITTGWG